MKHSIPDSGDYIRYQVAKYHIVLSSGEVIEIKPETVSLMIDNQYHTSYLPLVNTKIKVDANKYFKILADRGKFRVNFEVKYWKEVPGKPVVKRVLFNKRFKSLLHNDTPKLFGETIKEGENVFSGTYDDDEPLSAENKYLSLNLYLFEETNLDAIYSVSNMVLDGADMSSVLVLLLSQSGVSKLLMAPLDNRKSYSDVVIPPMTLGATFKYLESHYGFYKEGAYLYLGLIHSFLLPKRPGIEAWYKDEMRRSVFTIRKSDKAQQFQTGSTIVFEDFTGYMNVKPSNIMIQTPDVLDYIIGNKIQSIDTRAGSTSSSDVKSVIGNHTKILHNKYSNSFQTSMYAGNLKKARQIIYMTLNYVNIKWLEPNKEFICNFEDTNIDKVYGGGYQLEVSQIVFRNKGDHMYADAVIKLSR